MEEEVTQILEAMRTALLAEYPDIPVLVKAASAAHAERPVMPGWVKGSALPSFVISSLDPETIDTSGSFELVSVSYPVVVEWCRSGPPANYPNDPDTRQKRITLMEMFYRNTVTGFPASVFDGRYRPLGVYSGNEEGNVVISAQMFTYTLTAARPGTS